MWLSPFHSPYENISDYEIHWAWQLKTFPHLLTSLVAQNLPTMQETHFWSLGWEDPLEKEMATNSSTLTWRIPWTEEPGRLQSMGSQRVGHDCATFFFPPFGQFLSYKGLSLPWGGKSQIILWSLSTCNYILYFGTKRGKRDGMPAMCPPLLACWKHFRGHQRYCFP